jgi:hypothetical protein
MTDQTRPPELVRIAKDEYEFRLTVLEEITESRMWRRSHEKSDDERHAFVISDLADLKSRSGNVSSRVGESEKELSKYDGIKIGLGIAASIFLVIGGALWAIFTYFNKTP